MKWLSLVFVLLFMVGCDRRTQQRVIVVDSEGKPIADVRVQFNAASSPRNPVAYTNQEGVAVNPDSNFGPSYVTASKRGYVFDSTPVGKGSWPLRIELRRE